MRTDAAAPTRPPPHLQTDAEREAAMERFRLLRPVLEEGVPLTQIAREQGLPLRTARRWLQQYRRHGLAGLQRQPRSDAGQRRRVSPELQQLIEGLMLRRPPPSVASVHRQVAALAVERGEPPPSYRCVLDVVHQLDPALVTLAQEGPKAYRERYDLLYRREASRPNEIWQADHTLLDLWVRDEHGIPARPWLTLVVDDYSRAIAGYYLSFQAPSALQTALALRQAIWRKEEPRWHVCGLPEILYTDHGSDFTSRHLEQVAADLRIRLVFSQPGAPRGRGRVERCFGTVNQLLLAQLPGYFLVGGPDTATLTLPAFDQAFRAFLHENYHPRDHGSIGMAPQARWEAGGFLPRLPDSLEQLDLLLLTVAKSRRVHPDGIRFQGQRYLDLTLSAYVGEEVTVRYDPRDLAEIRVFHQERFLCRAVCQELAGLTLSLKEIVQARNRRRRELRGVLSEHREVVDTFLGVHQAPLPPAAPDPATTSEEGAEASALPRLKRYYHE